MRDSSDGFGMETEIVPPVEGTVREKSSEAIFLSLVMLLDDGGENDDNAMRFNGDLMLENARTAEILKKGILDSVQENGKKMMMMMMMMFSFNGWMGFLFSDRIPGYCNFLARGIGEGLEVAGFGLLFPPAKAAIAEKIHMKPRLTISYIIVIYRSSLNIHIEKREKLETKTNRRIIMYYCYYCYRNNTAIA